MEKWQKDHFVARRSPLLETITVNEQLLAILETMEILCAVDIDQIKCKENNFGKRRHLLDIIETRSHGYEHLAYALSECKQQGALEILMEGYILNVPPSFKIKWGGEAEKPISSILDQPTISKICEKISNTESSIYLDLYTGPNSRHEVAKILRDTIPPEAEHYIPRSLPKRVFLKHKMFKVNCFDIFVFKGIHSDQLEKFVEPKLIADSSSQLLRIDKRFIILDCDADWEELRDLAKVPIHLVMHQSSKGKHFMLQSTSGGSTAIHKYLYAADDKIISEDDFVEEILTKNQSGICICDVPGMGKSLLLASIARKLAMRCPERHVAFIRLSPFMEHMEKEKISATPTVSSVAKAITDYLLTSQRFQMPKFNFQEILTEGSTGFDLFFDGFDEVPLRQVELTKKLLQIVAESFLNTRIYVTSRTHTRHELEASLKVISYDILPFTHENQLHFLTSFWKRHHDQKCDMKLTEFANFCLMKLKENLNEMESDITGIPLQCRLVAEVFSRNAKLFSNPLRSAPIEQLCKFEGSFAHIYKRYMDIRFSYTVTKVSQEGFLVADLLSLAEQATNLIEVVAISSSCTPAIQPISLCVSPVEKLKQHHFYEAIKTLFPECSNTLPSELRNIAATCNTDKLFKIGLLEGRHDANCKTVDFLHRTFAEYLAADGFVRVFNHNLEVSEKSRLLLLQMFFLHALRTDGRGANPKEPEIILPWFGLDPPTPTQFVHPVFAHFLNFLLGECANISCNQDMVLAFTNTITAEGLLFLLQVLLCRRYSHILKLIKQVLSGIGTFKRYFYKRYFFRNDSEHLKNLLELVVKYSCPADIIELFADFFGLGLLDVCRMVDQCSFCPLTLAVKHANVEMVKFFIDKISLKDKSLALLCFHDSYHDSSSKIEKRINIFNLLLAKHNDLVRDERNIIFDISMNLLSLKCLMLLLKNGADLYVDGLFKQTIVQKAANYMSPDELHELYRYLIEDCHAVDLFSEKSGEWSSPMERIRSKCHSNTIKMIDVALKTKLSLPARLE